MALSSDLPHRCVLVVDDSKFVRKTFASILSASFAVREEADGEAAWHALESDPSIVMVFTDLDMPKLTGFGLLGRIRGSSHARIRDLPVVVISGYEEEGNKQRAREGGANDFIAKSADASEVLSRLENVLRLVSTRKELEASRQALDKTATHDPATGAFTPHYLTVEGRKHFAHARRHGRDLSVMALRVDTHAEISRVAGRDIADLVLARIAKVLMERVRAEDTVARISEAGFIVLAKGNTAEQMLALAQRLQRELDQAKVAYRGKPLRFASSFGVASLGHDTADSFAALVHLAQQRLETAANRLAERVARAPSPGPAAGVPGEIERALRRLEKADWARLAEAAPEVLSRLQRIAARLKR